MGKTYRMYSFDQNRQVLDAFPEPLTARQLDVLALLCEGLPNKEIARRLNVASGTVKIHVGNILRALNVATRLQAVVAVRSMGFLKSSAPAENTLPDAAAAARRSVVLRLVASSDQQCVPAAAMAAAG